VATGTGDMALLAAKRLRSQRITGIDISGKMLEIGRQKVAAQGLSHQIELVAGDSEEIHFANATFDGVMAAFGVRNFENLEQGLREILRVMKPGARLVVLEFSKPKLPLVKQFYSLYMGSIAPQLAHLFRQDKKAYQYLNDSAKGVSRPRTVCAYFKQHRLCGCYFQTVKPRHLLPLHRTKTWSLILHKRTPSITNGNRCGRYSFVRVKLYFRFTLRGAPELERTGISLGTSSEVRRSFICCCRNLFSGATNTSVTLACPSVSMV
jgi:ubiquinone/menaquinone biosynthesis methyltransferase